jgi:hypothetical protein
MITYWEVKDIASATRKCKTTVQKLIRLGVIKATAKTKRGQSLFDPQAIQAAVKIIKERYVIRERDVVRNRWGVAVIVDESGYCTICNKTPRDCSPANHE